MFRPCIIKDISESPFDACIAEVFKDSEDLEAYILVREEKNRMCLFKHYVKCNSIEELDSMYNSWVFIIAKAMNPHIKVTDAVLKAMEKVPEAKFSILNKDFYIVTSRYGSLPIFKDRVDNKWFYYYDGLIELKIGDYVQADCPLALQVLLQFTVEGVPKDD
jgi:hypothetical protein